MCGNVREDWMFLVNRAGQQEEETVTMLRWFLKQYQGQVSCSTLHYSVEQYEVLTGDEPAVPSLLPRHHHRGAPVRHGVPGAGPGRERHHRLLRADDRAGPGGSNQARVMNCHVNIDSALNCRVPKCDLQV